LILILMVFDGLYMRRRTRRLTSWEASLREEKRRIEAERLELRHIRQHLELLQEDFAKLECEIAHIPGDCPYCGAL